MAFTKITDGDLLNKGVIGLPDTPGLSTTDMQNKLEETVRDVAIPKHNELIDELEASAAAGSVGALNGVTATTVQNALNGKEASLSTAGAETDMEGTDNIIFTKTSGTKKIAFSYFAAAIKAAIGNATELISGLLSNTDKIAYDGAVEASHTHSNKGTLDAVTAAYTTEKDTKLSGIQSGAEANQNAYSIITVGATNVSSNAKTGALTMIAGANMTITPDAENRIITFASSGGGGGGGSTWYFGDAIAGTSTTPTAYETGIVTAVEGDFYINNGTANGNMYQCTLGGDEDTALWKYVMSLGSSIPWANVTGKPFSLVGSSGLSVTTGTVDVDFTKVQEILFDATTSVSGKMSAADKTKLDGVEEDANNYSLPAAATGTRGGITPGTGITMDGDVCNTAVAGLIDNETDFDDQTESTTQAVDSYLLKLLLALLKGKYIPATLTASATSVTITDAAIVTGNTITADVYADADVNYTSMTVTTGQIVLAYPAQVSDVHLMVVIKEVG